MKSKQAALAALDRLSIALSLFILTLAGCAMASGATPSQEWVRASRGLYESLGVKLEEYLDADPAMVDDPQLRGIYDDALLSWELMIRQGEALYADPDATRTSDE